MSDDGITKLSHRAGTAWRESLHGPKKFVLDKGRRHRVCGAYVILPLGLLTPRKASAQRHVRAKC